MTHSRILPFFLAILGTTFGLVLFTAEPAIADTITGHLMHEGANRPLKMVVTKTGRALTIDASANITKCLRGLRQADLLTVQGSVNEAKQQVTIDSIDRLGLQELLGAWRTDRWEIFEFKNFSQLEMYIPTAVDNGPRDLGGRTRFFRYAVTPEQDDGFSIFMTDDHDVRMGFMKVTPERIAIAVLDPKTGQVAENISLSPIRLK